MCSSATAPIQRFHDPVAAPDMNQHECTGGDEHDPTHDEADIAAEKRRLRLVYLPECTTTRSPHVRNDRLPGPELDIRPRRRRSDVATSSPAFLGDPLGLQTEPMPAFTVKSTGGAWRRACFSLERRDPGLQGVVLALHLKLLLRCSYHRAAS